MAGFAILVSPELSDSAQEHRFQDLIKSTASFKQLDLPATLVETSLCVAAKLDTASSLHSGVIRDLQSGSWIMATGTVVALMGNNDPHALLLDLLRDYLVTGSKALEGYDGHYALVIYDCQNERLSIISDPMGCFSIFYSSQGNQTLISTSALAIAILTKAEPDILCMESYLRSGIVHGERTFWKDVKRVLPATIHIIDHNRAYVSEYWNPTCDENITRLTLDEAIEYADELIKELMPRILSREGKVWADLTGGFDSRVTTMYMDEVGIPFIAYSVGPEDHPDVLIPKRICQEMGWEYQQISFPDDWDTAQFNWLQTALFRGDARISVVSLASVIYGQQERSCTCKTNVTGLGLDEWREITYINANLFNWGKNYAYDRLLNSGILFPIPISAMRTNRENQVREEWKTYLSRLSANYSQFPNHIKSHAMFIRYRYPSHGGAYLSAVSGILRSISPFCFKAPVNFALSLPYKWRLFYHHHFIRSLLERKNIVLANIETSKGGPAVPIRMSNLHLFWPLWSSLLDQNINRVSRKVFHKSGHLHKQPQINEYPLLSWRTSLAKRANIEGLLNPSKMYSGGLYQAEAMKTLSAQAEAGLNVPWSFLERVMTIEMAMRATGTSIS